MISGKLFQMIFDEIANFLPDKWEKIVVYLEQGIDYYSYSFYVKINGKYIKCYDLENISDDDIFTAFENIDEALSQEWEKETEPWSNMTMLVDNSGNMKTYFDYTDLSEGNLEYKKIWENRYLV